MRHRPHDRSKRNLSPDNPSDIPLSDRGVYVITVTNTYGSLFRDAAQTRRNENDEGSVHSSSRIDSRRRSRSPLTVSGSSFGWTTPLWPTSSLHPRLVAT